MIRTIQHNTTRATTAALLTLAISLWASTAAAQSIRLQPVARVVGPTVRLSDVAAYEGLPGGAGRMVVLLARDGQDEGRIDAAQLERALRNVSINPAKVAFSGAAVCEVRFGPENVASAKVATQGMTAEQKAARPAEQTAKAVRDDIADGTVAGYITAMAASRLKCDAETVVVKFNRASVLLAAMPADEDVVISFEKELNGPGPCRWQVEYVRNGRRVRRLLSGSVCLKRTVAAAAVPMAAGRIIAAADIREVEIADDGSKAYYTAPDDLVGRQVRRAIGADEPFEQSNIDSPVLVRGGTQVWVTCGVVRMTARARASGRLGEMIRVENPRSGREFQAVVTGVDEVKVNLEPRNKAAAL